MLEHHAQTDAENTANLYRNLVNPEAAPDTLTQPDRSVPDSRVEDYLDHIIAPLVGRADYTARQEIRRDMRAHIDQLIAAHEELGSDPSEAVTAALRQFGTPSTVAQKWLNEFGEETLETAGQDTLRKSVGRSFKATWPKLALGLGLWTAVGVFADNYISGWTAPILYFGSGILLPALAGYFTGRKYAQSRPVLGTLLAQAAVIPLWPFWMMFLMQQLHHVEPDFRIAALIGMTTFAAIAPLGCFGAWCGAAGKRRRRRALAK